MVNIDNALKIDGWMSEAELRWLAEQATKHTRILEIGSWMGRSTRALADNTAGVVVAVDTWAGSGEEHAKHLAGKPDGWLYEEFLRNAGNLHNVLPYRGRSVDTLGFFAAGNGDGFTDFDMAFIDGDHSYEAVCADILAVRPLLAEGALLCGHDMDAGRPGVVRAVKELVPNVKMAGAGSIWYAA